mgnify:CR=1 FL=1
MNGTRAKLLVSALVAALVVALMPSQALAIGSILDVHEPLVDLDVRDEKLKVLRAVKPMAPGEVAANVVRGQYVSGWVEGERMSGEVFVMGVSRPFALTR